MKKKGFYIWVLMWCVWGVSCKSAPHEPMKPVELTEIPASGILTLSEQQLLSLDWHSPNRAGVRVRGKRIVTGAGVEFDILFPDNEPGHRSLNFVSSGEGGRGAMVGTNIQGFRSFALKVTLVSVNQQSDLDMQQKLIFGALIGLTATGQHCHYEPITLGFAESENTVIAQTPVQTDMISQIGFHIHLLNPQEWDPSGNLVTLRIESVAEGGEVPWRILEDDK